MSSKLYSNALSFSVVAYYGAKNECGLMSSCRRIVFKGYASFTTVGVVWVHTRIELAICPCDNNCITTLKIPFMKHALFKWNNSSVNGKCHKYNYYKMSFLPTTHWHITLFSVVACFIQYFMNLWHTFWWRVCYRCTSFVLCDWCVDTCNISWFSCKRNRAGMAGFLIVN